MPANYPIGADSFDVVMILGNSFGYFETVQDDLRVLKEVLRVLKPWGRLLIDVADGEYLRQQFPAPLLGVDRQEPLRLPRALALGRTSSG